MDEQGMKMSMIYFTLRRGFLFDLPAESQVRTYSHSLPEQDTTARDQN